MRPYLFFLISWLIPGSGHLLHKKYTKAVVFFSGILLLVVLGIIMEGKFFLPYAETSNNYGIVQRQFHPLLILGFLGDIGLGLFNIIVNFLGFAKGNIESVTYHYGTTYLVSAGLLNYMIALNAFDIAKKEGRNDL